jgi:plastocyanin
MLLLLAAASALPAVDVPGTIFIKHKLTRRKVTAAALPYDRGMLVPLASDPGEDQLAFERRHVVIYLDEAIPAAPVTATLAQRNRQFVPDLVVVPAGSAVSFPNIDPIFHNVFSLSKPKSFDLGNYANGQTRTVTFSKAGIVLVNCHLHTNMTAAIVVTPNACFARSGEDGHFELRNVPAGRHTVVAWHKAAGFFRKTIDVREGHPPVLEFSIPLSENGDPPAPADESPSASSKSGSNK